MKTNRTLAAKLFANPCPERGCVVLDQPQHLAEAWLSGISHALRPVFDIAALLLSVMALATTTLLLLCPVSAHAQGGVPLWTNFFPGGASAIALDSNGDVFVTGEPATIKYSNAGVPLWTNQQGYATAIALDSTGNAFVTASPLTIKYSSTGVPLWTNQQNSASVIALDSSGNVFVTGQYDNGSNHNDFVTVSYSNSGVPRWTNYYGGLGDFDNPQAITADSSGNVYVTGYSYTALNIRIVTIKYSGAGVPLWTNRSIAGAPHAIAVDGNGNVCVAGVADSNGGDYLAIKYSNSGGILWTRTYNGPPGNEDIANAMALDRNGNVFLTGGSVGGDSLDYTTIAYSATGERLWTKRYDRLDGLDRAVAIALDSSGNVIVTGNSGTIAYSIAGVPLWTNSLGASAIAVDSAGSVLAAGNSYTIKYSSSVSAPRLAFQKLNNELVLSWTNAGFNLQTAPAVTGPFTNLPAATSPSTNPLTAPQQFFRVKSE
jgi:hypothetical protein